VFEQGSNLSWVTSNASLLCIAGSVLCCIMAFLNDCSGCDCDSLGSGLSGHCVPPFNALHPNLVLYPVVVASQVTYGPVRPKGQMA
jgi:hypothetical protein